MNYLEHRTIGSYECDSCSIYVTESLQESFDVGTKAFFNEVAKLIIDSYQE